MLAPQPLRPGDPVAVIAPAGPFDRPSFEAGLAVLARRYRPSFDEGIFSFRHYLAGDDARRAGELLSALHGDAKAIFCARGGYGSMRLLPALQTALEAARARGETWTPKWLVGFSDVTALHLWLQRQDRVSLHAPVVTQLGRQPEVSDRLFGILESTEPAPALSGARTLVPGIAEGPLLGGNLAVLTRLLGTPFMPSLENAVLLLEDVTERPYRLDRMWTHLKLAGVFEQVVGIALGNFTECDEKDGSLRGVEIIEELAHETGLPCALDFPIGHGALNQPVPLGVRARLNAGKGTLEFLEPAAQAESGSEQEARA